MNWIDEKKLMMDNCTQVYSFNELSISCTTFNCYWTCQQTPLIFYENDLKLSLANELSLFHRPSNIIWNLGQSAKHDEILTQRTTSGNISQRWHCPKYIFVHSCFKLFSRTSIFDSQEDNWTPYQFIMLTQFF